MQLDGGSWDPFFSEEVGDLDPLIALELDDLAHLLVVDEGSVAGKFLQNRVSARGTAGVSQAIRLPS